MSAAEIVIRPVRLDDWEAIADLRRQPRVMQFTTAIPSERGSRAFIESLKPDDHVFVAETAGRVVGVAGVHVQSGKKRHIGRVGIAVHDAFARRGIGRALMRAAVDLADQWLGLARLELDVDADNQGAIKLYESFGFEHEGRQRKAYFTAGRYVDALLMARLG